MRMKFESAAICGIAICTVGVLAASCSTSVAAVPASAPARGKATAVDRLQAELPATNPEPSGLALPKPPQLEQEAVQDSETPAVSWDDERFVSAAAVSDRPPTPLAAATAAAFRELFEATLLATDPSSLGSSWMEHGFELVLLDSDAAVWALRELVGERTGRGLYAFRPSASQPVLWSAPHAVRDDLRTGAIVWAAFLASDAKAGAWSTVPREDVDLAHVTETVFQQFTRAFAATVSNAMVVQVHGYRRDKRKSEAGRASEAILSNGSDQPEAALRQSAHCMTGSLAETVGVYPEVPELGATTNVQGRALASMRQSGESQARFAHVELSRPLRKKIKEQPEAVEQLVRCLLGGT